MPLEASMFLYWTIKAVLIKEKSELEDKIQAIMKSWKDWKSAMKSSPHHTNPIRILKPLPSLNKNKER